MSFGGATQAMITAIRNNKKLLSDRKARTNDLKKLEATYTEGVEQKQFSTEEIEAVKKKIKQQAQKDKNRSRLVLIITIIVAPVVFYLMGVLLYELLEFNRS